MVDHEFDLPHRFKQPAIYYNLDLSINEFFNKIIPNTKELALNIISHIHGSQSLYNYLQYFASLMIDFNTILLDDALFIQETIDKKIDEWMLRYEQRLNHLMTTLTYNKSPEIDSSLYVVLKDHELQQQFVEIYNVNPKINNLAILIKLYNLDSIRLYTTLLTNHIELYQTIDTEEFISTIEEPSSPSNPLRLLNPLIKNLCIS